jgi:HEAT repeat protein
MTDELKTSGASSSGEEWEASDVPLEQVTELFVVLGKAFRAYQLYEENNPVRHRFVESLRQALQGLWKEVDKLVLQVEEDRILLSGSEIYASPNRAESLAFLFFKDGVRQMIFLPGLEDEELDKFLGVLQRARKLLPEGDDLLTVLWEADLHFFQYQYVDFLAEGVSLPEAGPGNDQSDFQNVLDGEAAEEEDDDATEAEAGEAGEANEDAPKTASKDDFNPTLYSLDPKEKKTLREELEKELKRDLRGDVLAALFDRLEEPENPARQSEIIGVLGTLLPNFLSRGALVGATQILEELRRMESMPGVFGETQLAESGALLDEVSAAEAVHELIQALYDGSIRASPAQLGGFLRFLRSGALAPLLRSSETVDHKELQAVLREAVKGIAERNRSAVVRLLDEEDAVIASGAARLAGEMQIAEAGPSLAGLLAHPAAEVRLAAVEAAITLKASTAAGALQHTLEDPEREVRIAAARAMGVLKYRPAAARFAQIVGGKDIRTADISEKVAFFEAYGLLAEDEAVETLDKLLNGKGFLGKREPSEIRAAAALALGKVPGAGARAALQKGVQAEDPIVRSAVNRALREED